MRQLIQVLVLELERAALEALGHGLADDFQREVFAGETATEVDSHAVTSSSSAGVGRVIRTLKSNRGRTSLMTERHLPWYHSESRRTTMVQPRTRWTGSSLMISSRLMAGLSDARRTRLNFSRSSPNPLAATGSSGHPRGQGGRVGEE